MTTITTDPTTTVSVRGDAELEVAPDDATVSFACTSRAAASDDALRSAGRLAEQVRAVLTDRAGVETFTIGRVRVSEVTHWDREGEQPIHDGYSATVSGRADVDTAEVGPTVTALVAAGAQISWVSWGLRSDNPAYREVRKLAVAEAHRAAEDFADAVGVPLGVLITLADPGLLGAGVPQQHDVRYAGSASASFTPEPLEDLDLDPEPQTVTARVEACFRLGA